MCDALRELMKPEMEEEINKAVNKAVNEAVDKALDQKTNDVAERMIRAGKYSDADIADITGLTAERVEAIKSEMSTIA